ncbi:pre-rRNA-processing protein TSR1 homolog [Ananas comosus]|uniref:Pre-rRNA-processing protein TSR1 homolog n=1 Tax=Ananas comosus TaxID=4615 RepID=A0A6P5GII5_ANACO|nr:pre-rRNA-processing protein TSR1 homolog [Ananas comosus]
MGGSRTQVNKPHKTRFASKASRHAHKTSVSDKSRIAKPDAHRAAVKGARAARIQRNKAIRDQKRAALLNEKRASSGSASPPRVVVLFGLSSDANTNLVAKDLLTLSLEEDREPNGTTIASSFYKLRMTVLEAPYGDLLSCMELAKVADMIAFVVSANSLCDKASSSLIDDFGKQCLSVFRSIGLPSTAVLIRDLPPDIKSKQELKKMSISCLSSELPEDCRFYAADTKEDLHKFMWLFKEQHLSSPHWRSQRPYVMSQEVCMEPGDGIPGMCTLLLSGYVRAHSLSVNQLVHVSGLGDFQLSKIDILKDPSPLNVRKDSASMDSEDNGIQIIGTLIPDPMAHEPLIIENIPDPLAGEQTWPTESEMAEADASNKQKKLIRKKLPKGTSDYQAAWILDDSDNEDSGSSEEEGDGMVLDEHKDRLVEEGADYSDTDEIPQLLENFEEETEADTEMADDENLTKEQIEAEIRRIKDANAEDQEFPDEVDTPIDTPARKRFAKYRGLKSFRTSSWDPKESLPPEYARIFAFDNFSRTQKHAFVKVQQLDRGTTNDCAQVGSFVRLHVKHVPVEAASTACHLSKRLPVVACGLLQHESKMSVLHFSVKKNDSYDAPIKSKEVFTFHVGFRQFTARPLFSSDNINCDKHKMERFLHAGRFSVASIYGPICYPPLPLIVLKNMEGAPPAVAAVGSLKSVDPDRIILKKIILTGYPQRVSKSKAIVRYMFHHPEDVRWFKPVDVWTKHGRHGRVKEPVGTHGAMKCVFNSAIQQHDTVCMSLYKRAYPKWPEQHFPS